MANKKKPVICFNNNEIRYIRNKLSASIHSCPDIAYFGCCTCYRCYCTANQCIRTTFSKRNLVFMCLCSTVEGPLQMYSCRFFHCDAPCLCGYCKLSRSVSRIVACFMHRTPVAKLWNRLSRSISASRSRKGIRRFLRSRS